MKYYYNGKLVRTSDHEYTHAVIDMSTGKCKGCRASEEKAMAIKAEEIGKYEARITGCLKQIKALEEGKTFWYCKYGRDTFKTPIRMSKAELEQMMADIQKDIDRIGQSWQIVKLEAK